MLRRSISVGITVIVLIATSLPVGADGDWFQFRGPSRDDISKDTGLLKEWPKGGPPLVWKATDLGIGFSGPSMAGDRIYTMGDKGDANYLIALDRGDGKIVWSTKVGKSGAPGWGGFAGPRSSPTIDGDRVYALGQYGELVCAEVATGKEIWRKHYVNDLGAKVPEWGYTESVLVDDKHVICTPGGPQGTVAALKKSTGEVAWRTKDLTDGAAYSSIIEATHGDVRQFIVLTDKSLAGFAADDGRTLWRAKRQGKIAVIPTPIFHDGKVFVTSGYEIGCNLFRIDVDGGNFKVTQEYSSDDLDNHHGGAVLLGDYVYGHADSNGWVCMELSTGKIVWKSRQFDKGSLTYADGHFYLREEKEGGKGTVSLIEATPEGYKEKGRFEQSDRRKRQSWTHPVVTGGRLYLRDQDILLCYDVKAK